VVTPSLATSPATVVPGRPFDVTLRFAVAPDAPAFTEDYTVFVHFIDADDKMVGTADHDPPTPTRAWKPASTVEYTQSIFAPASRYRGAALVVVGLYSRSSGERVPLAGDVFEPRAVTVGKLEIRDEVDPYAVSFDQGWHAVETDRAAGLEWRWSTKSGALSFPNPRRSAELVLGFDQPAQAFPVPQHVEVKLGDAVVDAFDLTPGVAALRRISLDGAQLGDGQTVVVRVVTDKTFIPADVAALQSSDTRQLGVRVFRAYVEPK